MHAALAVVADSNVRVIAAVAHPMQRGGAGANAIESAGDADGAGGAAQAFLALVVYTWAEELGDLVLGHVRFDLFEVSLADSFVGPAGAGGQAQTRYRDEDECKTAGHD